MYYSENLIIRPCSNLGLVVRELTIIPLLQKASAFLNIFNMILSNQQ